MLTEKDIERWKILVNDCKGEQRSINVGGKEIRKIIIEVDEILKRSSLAFPYGRDIEP